MNTIWQPDLSLYEGPKYKKLVQALRHAVKQGDLAVAEKLPPVRDLAWRVNVTPGTVARAYTILTDEGVLDAAVGRGTFVADPAARAPVTDALIEIDAVPHGQQKRDSYEVNLYSPHLAAVGQDRLIRQLLAQIAANPPSGIMHYPNPNSAEPARKAVASWLAGTPLGAMDAWDVVLTNGGQNGIMMAMQAVLRGSNPTILVEELSYPGFRRAAELLRVNVVPVAMDADGVIPDALAAAAREHNAKLFCTSPEVHNPTCTTTPLHRREEIAAVARKLDLNILEDDCYYMGRARGPTYRMLVPELGWYVTSISKTITPALRIGFSIAPVGRTADLRRAAGHSFFGLATPLIDLCTELFVHPDLPGYVEDARAQTNRYVKTAANVLGGYELNWREDVPFLWLQMPLGWRASQFCQAAETVGVQIRAGEEFTCRDTRAPHAVRLAINCGVSLESFEAAMLRLRGLLDNPTDRIAV